MDHGSRPATLKFRDLCHFERGATVRGRNKGVPWYSWHRERATATLVCADIKASNIHTQRALCMRLLVICGGGCDVDFSIGKGRTRCS